MYILKSPIENKELPIKIHLSFDSVFTYLEQQAADKNSIFYDTAKKLLAEMNQYPILREGFTDFSMLKDYEDQIQRLLSILFPDLLQSNEIKAVSIPFDMTSFMLSKRFESIMKNAGEDYVFDIRNFDNRNMYILTCVYILAFCYNKQVDFKRPFFYDIPDVKNNTVKSYRALYNADFAQISKTENAPEITEDDIKVLLNNFENIDVWKEKFPPNSYVFKGFGMINLFDVTQDEVISEIKNTFIKRNIDSLGRLEKHIQQLLSIPKLRLGISIYNKKKDSDIDFVKYNNEHSLIVKNICSNPQSHFCNGIVERVFKSNKITTIPDLKQYGKRAGKNDFYKKVSEENLKSIILVPIELNNDYLAILELASDKKYELNSINANKLRDIIPVLSITIERSIEERQNLLESIIQENYTTIHPSVKWKFYNSADNYLSSPGNSKKLKDIRFKNVYPLYGQCDVKGSSEARNKAIQEDLELQLEQTIDLFEHIYLQESLPVFKEIIFKSKEYLNSLSEGIKTTDELLITDFFKSDIYPALNHLKGIHSKLKEPIQNYLALIDENLGIIYHKRKAYESFITNLNNALANHIDKAQKKAQNYYPHYFERFKTDGVDYNIYIGESITSSKSFHPIYTQNLKLWQLQQQCEMEYIAQKIDEQHPEISLQVTSLILVHSLPLDIKFRMDEKKFDVDGAYNMRYEIIKKRIDKSYIKNTEERLTQTGKIAIVYTHEQDLKEYLKYIEYLKDNGYLKGEAEILEIEDLQGVSGLKAIRVDINFDKNIDDSISFEKLLKDAKIVTKSK